MDLFDIVVARQGGGAGGGAPQVQSDWEQNDSSKKDYIKNKPFYESFNGELTTSPTTNFRFKGVNDYGAPDLLSMNYSKIGLIAGETYEINAEILIGNTTITTSFTTTAIETTMSLPDIEPIVMIDAQVATVCDRVKVIQPSLTDDSGYFENDNDSCLIIPSDLEESTYWNIDFTVTGLLGEKELKKIDKKFLPVTEPSIATYNQLGVVKGATSYNSTHTKPVSVDNYGQLWTEAVKGLTSVSLSDKAGATGNEIRHPVYRNNQNLLYAKVLTASSNYVGGVKVNGSAIGYLPCTMVGDFIYATMPTAATTIDSTSTSFPTTKAVYDYVADQINTIYADLEGDVY